MSDYRNRSDQVWRNTAYKPAWLGHNAAWGWITGAVCLAFIFAIAFGVGHQPNRTAYNDIAPPVAPYASPWAPPAGALKPAEPVAPGLAPALAGVLAPAVATGRP